MGPGKGHVATPASAQQHSRDATVGSFEGFELANSTDLWGQECLRFRLPSGIGGSPVIRAGS